MLATIAIVISYTVITSYQFKGGGDILHLIFPSLDRETGMYIIAAFVITFTALAGMASVAYLDLIIGLLVTVIMLVSLPILLARAGGWSAVHARCRRIISPLSGRSAGSHCLGFLLPTHAPADRQSGHVSEIFLRPVGEETRAYAVFGWIVGTVVLETVIITVAVIGSSTLQTEHPREIIPLTARMRLPELVGAILLGGVFAKVISTANNYLFSPASNLIHDVYKRFIDPQASERRTLFVSRGLVIALGLFALLQAAYFESVLKAALYAYTVYGAAVTPSVMAVFFWKRANTAGAISSIVLGTVITVVWQILDIQWLDAVYPALGVSVLALIVVSLATAPPTRANLEPFEK